MSEPPVLVRAYAGRTKAEAGARLAEDEEALGAEGYVLASQVWAERFEYGVTSKALFAVGALLTAGGWLITPMLSLIAMVFLVAGVMTRTRTGELTVTWTKVNAGAPTDPGSAPS